MLMIGVVVGRVVGKVVGRVVHLVPVWVLPFCLKGHLGMSHKVSQNGVNIWIVDRKSRGQRCP